MRRAAIFIVDDRMREYDVLAMSLVRCLGDFTSAVLWAYGLPFGDRSLVEMPPEHWRQYAKWRRSLSETRGLCDAPGHKFDAGEHTVAAKAVEFAIQTGWDAALFAAPLRCVIRLSHDGFIEIHTHLREDLSKVSKILGQLGLSEATFGMIGD